MDYVLTDRGHAFLSSVLQTCAQQDLSWNDLWLHEEKDINEAIRELNLPAVGKEGREDTVRLLGVFALVQLLFFSPAVDFREAVVLLGKADLLTEANIEIAAETLGVQKEEIWGLLALDT